MGKLDRLGYAFLIALVSGLVWVPFTLKYAHYQATHQIKQQAEKEAQHSVNQQMQKACTCWFNDSRCKPAGKIVACSMPPFMQPKG